MTAEEKLRKAKLKIVVNMPFFAALIMIMPFEETDKCDTMCTEGKKVYYSPKFIEKLDIKELIFVILHEILHCSLGHIWRVELRDKMIWNIATDYAVNNILHNYKSDEMSMPKLCLYDEKYKNKSAEAIYDDLLQNAQKNKISISLSNDNNNGNGKNQINAPKNHDIWENGESSDKYEWEANTKIAAEAAKEAGNTPEGIEEIIKTLDKPQKNWKHLLHSFIQKEINDFSLMPPDYRYQDDFFIFSFSDTTDVVKDLLFFVDTSGSMSNEDLTKCYSEIAGALVQFNKHLYGKLGFFDAKVYDPLIPFDNIKNITDIKCKGRGGTRYDIIFDYVNKYKESNEVAGIIIFSDGYCSYDDIEQPDYPVLWIYTTHDNEPPFGFSATLE